jgi:hypothetical protein
MSYKKHLTLLSLERRGISDELEGTEIIEEEQTIGRQNCCIYFPFESGWLVLVDFPMNYFAVY